MSRLTLTVTEADLEAAEQHHYDDLLDHLRLLLTWMTEVQEARAITLRVLVMASVMGLESGLSQVDIAIKTGYSRAWVSRTVSEFLARFGVRQRVVQGRRLQSVQRMDHAASVSVLVAFLASLPADASGSQIEGLRNDFRPLLAALAERLNI